MIDYRKFKTPYYQIEIRDSAGKRKVKLPHHILRLCVKVELFEALSSENGTDTLTLDFIEGSREPASTDASMGTSGLYKIPLEGDGVDMEVSGSMTNRTGVLTDLRFSGNSGITFITEQEKKTGKLDNKIQENVEGKKTTRKFKRESSAPVFLFQQRNQVKVTWGYIEDPKTVRSFVGYISIVQTDFPESSMPTTKITCQGALFGWDQISTKATKTFGKRITTSKGNSIIQFQDLKTDEVLRNISDKTGIPVIISKDMEISKFDKDKQKMWLAGESFKEFMDRMAAMENAMWKVVTDPKTGVDNIVFITKKEFEARMIPAYDPNLFTFRAPGSILKSVSVKVDFGGIGGNAQVGLNENGEVLSKEDMVGRELFTKYNSSATKKPEEAVDIDPNSTNPISSVTSITDNIAGGDVTGTVEHNPRTDEAGLDKTASVTANKQHNIIQLDFTTIGFTKMTPGVIELKGIGVRYSGKYRILTVTHTIDSSGYITKCTATSLALPRGGVKLDDTPKGQEKEEFVTRQLFSDPAGQYHKLQGTD